MASVRRQSCMGLQAIALAIERARENGKAGHFTHFLPLAAADGKSRGKEDLLASSRLISPSLPSVSACRQAARGRERERERLSARSAGSCCCRCNSQCSRKTLSLSLSFTLQSACLNAGLCESLGEKASERERERGRGSESDGARNQRSRTQDSLTHSSSADANCCSLGDHLPSVWLPVCCCVRQSLLSLSTAAFVCQ